MTEIVDAGAQTFSELAYADRSPAQRLDLHLPARHGTAVPLVLVIHGGAFAGGDKADEPGIVKAVLDAGWAAASVNYRLSGEALFPAGVQDVKAAVRWLRARAGEYGVDPDRFAAWGTSAGAHLAAMLGTTGSTAGPLDDPELGHPQISSAVQAVVDWYGPSDFRTMDRQAIDPGGCPGAPQRHDPAGSPESRWLGGPVPDRPEAAAAASPISYLTGAVPPPFAIVHGQRDCLVPYGQSEQLARALEAAGGRVELTLPAEAGHADPTIARDHTAPAIAFLREVFG
jgi:acetyl esterase/lipase